MKAADEIRKEFTIGRLFAEKPKMRENIIETCRRYGSVVVYGDWRKPDAPSTMLPQYADALVEWAKSEGFNVSSCRINNRKEIHIWV